MAHSQARELVTQGYTATLVSNTLQIRRSGLYYGSVPHAAERIAPMNRS